ncbi:uncharacterized protein PAC_11881 [Phialocephala subalpina]|uniref:Uncharacterized protein n=1 Tax=Phialocephala subalpina TaxID=576137 RepID=A0A1L7XAD1_9HELO|nr:uncharacterized protein PAC_11881 [Phialocephala subalpina]
MSLFGIMASRVARQNVPSLLEQSIAVESELTSPPGAYLERLPNEVLLMIVQDCHEHDLSNIKSNNKDNTGELALCNLTLTSKRLKEVAEPVLYETIPELKIFRLLKFLRSILDRPALASHVIRFASADDGDEDEGPGQELRVLFREESDWKVPSHLKQIVASIDSEDILGNRDWILDLFFGRRWDCAVATTTLLLPRLRYLSVCMPCGESSWNKDQRYEGHYKYIHKVLRHAAAQAQPQHPIQVFERLETVAIKNAKGDFNMASIASFAKSSPLHRLIIETDHLPSCEDGHWQSEFAIQSLEVRLSHHFVYNLEKFLRCFPMLQDFRYIQNPEARRFPLNNLARTLIEAKLPLKRLQLGPAPQCTYHSRSIEQIESLASFQGLLSVDVIAFDLWPSPNIDNHNNNNNDEDSDSDLDNFVDAVEEPASDYDVPPLADLLPESIERLTLRDGTTRTFLHVQSLLEVKYERVPNLKVVNIVPKTKASMEAFKEESHYLGVLSAKCGVTFMMTEAEIIPVSPARGGLFSFPLS